jgi:hypothetical protein
MQIESHKVYAVLGGIILGVGSGLALGDSPGAKLGFVVGLSLMWVAIFYTATQSQQEEDAV